MNAADNKGAAGIWAGDSFIDLNLKLVDSSNSELIADVLVRQRADARTGGWSVGRPDQNIDAFVVAIIRQYLSEND